MAHLNFAWEYVKPDNVTFTLYENGVMVAEKIVAPYFSLLMDGYPEGQYSYYVTANSKTTGVESIPSETITVDFYVPATPTGFTYSWSD